MRTHALLLHLLNLLVPAAALAIVEHPVAVALSAIGFFFGAFSLMHDAMHGALGLSRSANEAVLVIAGALSGASGHGARQLHLRHHARPMAADDLEGIGARTTLLGAVLHGPASFLAFPEHAWLASRPRERRWQLVEWALVLAGHLTCVAIGGNAHALVLVTLFAHLSMQVWASHLPHRAPRWLLRVAAGLDWLPLPIATSLAHHELHHLHPRFSCFELPAVARRDAGERGARKPRVRRPQSPLMRPAQRPHDDVRDGLAAVPIRSGARAGTA